MKVFIQTQFQKLSTTLFERTFEDEILNEVKSGAEGKLAWERVALPQSTHSTSGDVFPGHRFEAGNKLLGGKRLKRAATKLQMVQKR